MRGAGRVGRFGAFGAVGALVAALLSASGAGAAPGVVSTLPGLQAPARIVRTTDGIPHITALNKHDVYFLQGWVHAQDRLFQMDYLRRVPSGTLAELLGPGALPSDVQLRTIGLRRAAERSWAAADSRMRAAMTAYAQGVNAYAGSHPLPPEYQALELTSFAPWTPVDSLVIGRLVSFQLSFDLDIDPTMELAAYQAAGAAHGFDGAALALGDLTAFAPFNPAATVPDATGRPAPAVPAATAGTAAAAAARAAAPALATAARLARRYRTLAMRVPVLKAALDRNLNGDHATGSNEWVISGRHTRDGRPILANDPHLGLDSPAIFYPIQLTAGALNVAGEGFAGAPGVIQGQNQYIAWGSTTNPMDVTDTYLEAVRPDPSSPSGLSTVYKGQLEHVQAIPETYRANAVGDGRADDLAMVPPSADVPPATLIVPRRNQGPIVVLDAAGGAALSVQYAGFSATQELEASLIWDESKNLTDFQNGLTYFDVGSQNWSYADRAGNIAYFTSGELPLREDLQAGHVAGLPPYFIRSGQGGNEWLPLGSVGPPGSGQVTQANQALPYDLLPPGEMPHLINPPAGWFVSANNDPTGATLDNDPLNQLRPGGGIYYLNAGYDGIRAGRITEMLRSALAGGRKIDAAGVARMQSDTVLLDAEFFAPRIVAAYRQAQHSIVRALRTAAADPGVTEAVARLAAWDHTTPTGLAQGYDAADVNGHLSAPGPAEVADSVAATIYAEWRSRFVASTVDAAVGAYGLPVPGDQRVLTALKRALTGGRSLSGVDLFPAPGIARETDRQALLVLTALRTALDRLAGPDFAVAFGGSTDQADYRWGKLHRLVLESPLGGPFSAPPAFGRFPAPLPGLAGVPVDGGLSTVDAATHGLRGDSATGFMFGSGPARRYVGVLTAAGPVGRSALPGGASAVPTERHYDDLLPAYLTDDSYLVRTTPAQIAAATESVQLLRPRTGA
ncbi:MAG: penicillin amidase [Mycobacteriales bacterium]